LDLHLTPYAVLATSADEGLVQRIPSRSVATVLKAYDNKIARFIEEKSAPLDHYIKSCAGYAVISYILGLGDRHLDNLLLTDDARLFHIDFGYILGRDPKYKISMKLTKEMVDGMGGTDRYIFVFFCVLVFVFVLMFHC
jgi:phosphatidylinositol 3-kinase